jgi:alpha-galactosidase
MKDKIALSFLYCLLVLTTQAQIKDIPFGGNGHIQYDLDKGTYDVIFNGRRVIKNGYAVCRREGQADSSTAFASRKWSVDTVTNGKVYKVSLSGGTRPVMQQTFYVGTGQQYFHAKVRWMVPACDYMSPLTTTDADLHEQGDNRALLVPFDNDAWVRYNALPLDKADFTGSEVIAVYNNTSRHGLILGSVEHQEWKTGIRIAGGHQGRLAYLSVFAGYTDKHYTHDMKGHGQVQAATDGFCSSPMTMVAWSGDWRTGLETYAKANISAAPRFIHPWTKHTPFGWNSWGAMQDKLTLSKAKAVVDFFHDSCSHFHTADSTLYIDLDSYWDLLLQGGINGDYSRLKEFCDYCKSKGFQPGIYWAPFVDWGKSPRKMEGSDYHYEDCWIRQNGNYNDLDGARALDATHPGTKARIAAVIGHFKDCGFKMIKIDFLGHAALEADHFYDPTVHTGMQAFRKGMEYLIQQLDGKMLVYAAISPNLATVRYVHMRRIACDAYSNISETGYTLNSTTYGWWQGKMYDHIDADHIVFGTVAPGMNRARLTSALVTGALITGDDYSVNGPWHAAAKILLQNKDLLMLAQQGKAFMPVEGNTGDQPGNIFVRKDKRYTWLAIVNYSDTVLSYTIDPARWGIPKQTMKELFSGKIVPPGAGTIIVPPADAVIYRQD